MSIFRIGAGIYVELEASPVPYTQLVRNSECFVVHSNSSLPPNKWEDVGLLVGSLYIKIVATFIYFR